MRQSLQSYVSQVMRQNNLSGYDVERQSQKGITQSSVHRIATGAATNPSTAKLKALAKGLDVPEAELFAVARGATLVIGDLAHDRLASIDRIYQGLSIKKKKRFDPVIQMVEREIKYIESER